MQPSRLPAWAQMGIEPLNAGNRFWARVINNITLGFLVILVSYVSPSPTATGAALVGSFLYYILFYRLLGGHVGHLLLGGRIRDTRTGGRVAFWQSVVRTGYEMGIVIAGAGVYIVGVLLGYNLAADPAMDRAVELICGLAIGIPMGIMVMDERGRP